MDSYSTSNKFVIDPIEFKNALWPQRKLYREQQQIVYSINESLETFVPAGNKLGKDYVSGFIVLWFFLTRSPCRIVTTSAKDDHLRVLWGEIGDWIQDCKYPLDSKRGGPLIINHQDIKKVFTSGPNRGQKCSISYITGLVASPDSIAAMAGHHVANQGDGIPRTLFIADECSSVPNSYYQMCKTWSDRRLFIGNTWPCPGSFWFENTEAGDLLYSDILV